MSPAQPSKFRTIRADMKNTSPLDPTPWAPPLATEICSLHLTTSGSRAASRPAGRAIPMTRGLDGTPRRQDRTAFGTAADRTGRRRPRWP